MILNEKQKEMYDDCMFLNEGKGMIALAAILALPFLVIGGFIGVLSIKSTINEIKEKKQFKQDIADFIKTFPECTELSKNITSIRAINIWELCKYLNVKDYKTKFPEAEIKNTFIKGIFSNEELISYGIVIGEKDNTYGSKMTFGIVDSKYRSQRNCVILIQTLLEYHFNVTGNGYKNIKKILKSNSSNKKSNANSVNKYLDKSRSSDKVPNITEENFNEMLEQMLRLSEELVKNIKTKKLYKKYYYPYNKRNQTNIEKFKSNIMDIKKRFNNGEIINKYDLWIHIYLNDCMEKNYPEELKKFAEENYEKLMNEIGKDAFKLIPKTFKSNEKPSEDTPFYDEKNYRFIKLNYEEHKGGEDLWFVIKPRKSYYLKQENE